MTPPAALLALIRRFEGLRLKPYLCPAGVPTIGYGSTGPHITMQLPPITVDQAEAMMRADAGVFASAALKLCPKLAGSDARLSAIADFAYNLGVTRLAGSTLRRKIAAEDWEGAGQELSKWCRGGGRVLPGLVIRRAAERQFLVGGA